LGLAFCVFSVFADTIYPLAWHSGARWRLSAASVCQVVCVNTITSERLNVG